VGGSLNPMDIPEVATHIAKVHENVLRAGRGDIVSARSVEAYSLGQYWQRTGVVGEDSLNVRGCAPNSAQQDESTRPSGNMILTSMLSAPISESQTSTRTAHVDLGKECNIASGGVDGAGPSGLVEISERIKELRTRLGIRTSAEIFESSQREYEEERANEGPSRKRARLSRNGEPGYDEMEVGGKGGGNSKREARIEEDVAAALRALEEEFEEKERQSDKTIWCAPIPRERMGAMIVGGYGT
jgi:hypothetical protein